MPKKQIEHLPKVSIIINNHNYGRFLKVAIDSALSQNYPKCEVIVVDDGSIDNSVDIITSYQRRIVPILQKNQGQLAAYNAGFYASSGDWILLLDADDYLKPEAIKTAVAHIVAGYVKIQFKLEVVEESGIPLNIYLPAGRMVSGDLLNLLLKYGNYGSPPGSGSMYLRSVLTEVFPLMDFKEWGVQGADTLPAYQAPFMGKIKSIDESLGYYRIHSSQGSPIFKKNSEEILSFLRPVIVEIFRNEKFLKKLALMHNISTSICITDTNPSLVKERVCFFVLKQDGNYWELLRLVTKGVKASIVFPLNSFKRRLFMSVWFVLMLVVSQKLKIKLIKVALNPSAQVLRK